jgi:hypothetical protein
MNLNAIISFFFAFVGKGNNSRGREGQREEAMAEAGGRGSERDL